VGAPLIIVALVVVAFVKSESHSNTDPLKIKAIRVLPKLSKDHKPGSATLSVVVAAWFHAE
tara:strand:- start:350 stop:532 length:183 start_codon:yes stop_codon:yes gene_type:complete